MRRYDIWSDYLGGGGLEVDVCDNGQWVRYEDAQAAIKAAVEAEREACAKACDLVESSDTDWDTSYWNQAVVACAVLIRAR